MNVTGAESHVLSSGHKNMPEVYSHILIKKLSAMK
jgi:hypothetical protein